MQTQGAIALENRVVLDQRMQQCSLARVGVGERCEREQQRKQDMGAGKASAPTRRRWRRPPPHTGEVREGWRRRAWMQLQCTPAILCGLRERTHAVLCGRRDGPPVMLRDMLDCPLPVLRGMLDCLLPVLRDMLDGLLPVLRDMLDCLLPVLRDMLDCPPPHAGEGWVGAAVHRVSPGACGNSSDW
ncbi:hypothetical protein [Luteimonas sp. TWI1416]|uniref:hypothetical protein n=1 Tax=unclassified Luteimonas TaxID=2629088 RepID=UPI0032079369